MQINTTVRYHLTPVRMATIKKSTNSKCWRGYGENRTLFFWWEYKLTQPPWRTIWRFLKKLRIKIQYYPVIPQWRLTEKDTCAPNVTASLFAIVRTWKQPRCPSADEQIRKLCSSYPMEYYSARKRNSFESVLMRWVNLKPIIQSEVIQKENDKYYILMHIYGIPGNPMCRAAKETQI